jgi:4-alpha-glucanotransferase
MHVLQFAFGENAENSIHIPHHHRVNGVVYTGTHDNNTSRGWFRKELDAAARTRLSRYAGKKVTASNVAGVMIALAYGSVARMAIVPLQDILGLNERYRYNIPSTVNRVNWRWRLSQVPDEDDALRLCELTRTFGR